MYIYTLMNIHMYNYLQKLKYVIALYVYTYTHQRTLSKHVTSSLRAFVSYSNENSRFAASGQHPRYRKETSSQDFRV